MGKLQVFDKSGKPAAEVDMPESVFAYPDKGHLVYEAVVNYRANQRQGTAATKTRANVAGGGRKPWRQKGTGRARAGSSTSPVWVGGGTVFGPKPKEYHVSVPKKVRKAALRSALSQCYLDATVKVLDTLDLDAISTKAFAGVMKTLSLSKPLLVVSGKNDVLEKSARNIPYTKVLRVEGLNVYDVMRHEHFVVTVEALQRIEEALSL